MIETKHLKFQNVIQNVTNGTQEPTLSLITFSTIATRDIDSSGNDSQNSLDLNTQDTLLLLMIIIIISCVLLVFACLGIAVQRIHFKKKLANAINISSTIASPSSKYDQSLPKKADASLNNNNSNNNSNNKIEYKFDFGGKILPTNGALSNPR